MSAKGVEGMILFFYMLLKSLISGVGLFALSSLSLTGDPMLMYSTTVIFAMLFPIRGLCYYIATLAKGGKVTAGETIYVIVQILAVAAIVLLPKISFAAFVIAFEIYLTFCICVELVDAYIYYKNRMTRYFVPSLCMGIFLLQIFIGVIVIPDAYRERLMMLGISVLWLLFGLAHICEFLVSIVPNRGFKRVMSSIRLTLPGFMGMCFPHRLFGLMRGESAKKEEVKPNAEVLFQFSRSGIGVAGHCELCIDGKTLTYGNYDPATRMVFRLAGDGIILRAQRDKYIDYVVKNNKKIVFSYGLRLNEEQMDSIRNKLGELCARFEDWSQDAKKLAPKEFARRLSDALGADVYKVTGGDFKTYFAPTINCVQITDYLLRDTDIGRALTLGVNSPGAYMELFLRLFAQRNSPVISMKVYGDNGAF